MSIALLTPTRARPEQFSRMTKSVGMTQSGGIDVKIFSCSNGGDEYALTQFPLDCPTAFMWNKLAEGALKDPEAKLFMLASDDIVFSTPCWDKALLDHYNALENKIHVYHLRDSRNEDGTPHPVFTREWIEFFGFMLPPIFLHFYVDTWSVEIAKHAGCFTHLKDYQLIHDKCNDKGKPDETHSRIRQQGWVDRDRYVYEKCQHYMELEKKRLKDGIIGSMSMNQRFKSGVRAW